MEIFNVSQETVGPISCPASPAQQQLWFLDTLMPDQKGYHIFLVFRIVGDLDHALLEQSVNNVVKRHESLRTSFQSIDGKLKQIVSASLHVPIGIVDLSFVDESEYQETGRSKMLTPA